MDTRILRMAASKRLGDRKIAAQVFARLESGVYEAKVSQTAMGEAAAAVLRDFDEGEWRDAYGRIMERAGRVTDPSTCIPPPGPKEVEMARRIADMIPRLGMTDALVVAGAAAGRGGHRRLQEIGALDSKARGERAGRRAGGQGAISTNRQASLVQGCAAGARALASPAGTGLPARHPCIGQCRAPAAAMPPPRPWRRPPWHGPCRTETGRCFRRPRIRRRAASRSRRR